MSCRCCQQDGPVQFCAYCGESVTAACPECGFANPKGFRHCGGCAAALGTQESEESECCVLVARLEVRTQAPLSAEQAVRLEQFAQDLWRSLGETGEVRPGRGEMRQVHFSTARAALAAGVAILAGVRSCKVDKRGECTARVGVASGKGRSDVERSAWRLHFSARPDQILVDSLTRSQCKDAYSYEPLGWLGGDGLQVFQVAVPGGKFRANQMVGRDAELASLRESWERGRTGQGEIALICAEAGGGKTRMVAALRDSLGVANHSHFEFRCSPFHRNTYFQPLIRGLRKSARIHQGDSQAVQLAKLSRMMDLFALDPGYLPILGRLLAITHADLPEEPTQGLKERVLRGLVACFLRTAESRPLFLVVEDLHWADPSTLDLIDHLLREWHSVPGMIVLTYRPDFRPPWADREDLTVVHLPKLGSEEVGEIAQQMVGSKALPADLLQHIVTKSDGVPLFVEELTRMVLDSKILRELEDRFVLQGSMAQLKIPSTLLGPLLGRLDRMETAQEVAQVASVIGRQFSAELLQMVTGIDDETLYPALHRLVEAQVLVRQSRAGTQQYRFKHALVQEAAYQSLLKRKRQALHKSLVEVLEEHFAEFCLQEPEFLAYHCAEGGLDEKAIGLLRQEAQRSLTGGACQEAVHMLTRAVHACQNLSEGEKHELPLQTELGLALSLARGYGSEEALMAYERALQLCHNDHSPQRFPALVGLWSFYLVRGWLEKSANVAHEALAIAQGGPQTLEIRVALGINLFYQGRFGDADSHFQAAGDHFEADFPYSQPQHPAIASWAYGAWSHWYQGRFYLANEWARRAVQQARKRGDRLSLGLAMSFAVWLLQLCGEVEEVASESLALLKWAEEFGFTQWRSVAGLLACWSAAETGQPGAADKMAMALEARLAAGAELALPYWSCLLAEQLLKDGRQNEAQRHLERALTYVDRQGERFYEPEVHRLRGVSLLASDPVAAEFCLETALNCARRTGAAALELRAALSLTEIWQETRPRDASHLLAELLERIPTADSLYLRQAREALSHLPRVLRPT